MCCYARRGCDRLPSAKDVYPHDSESRTGVTSLVCHLVCRECRECRVSSTSSGTESQTTPSYHRVPEAGLSVTTNTPGFYPKILELRPRGQLVLWSLWSLCSLWSLWSLRSRVQPSSLSEMSAATLTARLKDPRTCRVFVSSPFNGLERERQELVTRYFPQLSALCQERGVQFVAADMRWGITEAASRDHQVVSICLREIDRSDIFLGLYGQVSVRVCVNVV